MANENENEKTSNVQVVSTVPVAPYTPGNMLHLLTGEGELQYVCSIPKPSADASFDERRIYAAEVSQFMSKADAHVKDATNDGGIINCVNFFGHMVDIDQRDERGQVLYNQSGEPIRIHTERVVIADADGKTWEAVSQGVLKTLGVIVSLMGSPETWEGPVPLQVRRVSTNKGFETVTLSVANIGKAKK